MRTTNKIFILIGLLVFIFGIGGYLGFKQIRKTTYPRVNGVPTIYLHGWGASGQSTNSMIMYAQKYAHAQKVLTVVVPKKGQPYVKGEWTTGVARPLIQIVFKDNKESNYQLTSGWLKKVMVLLKTRYHVNRFNAVAHSMGNLTLMYYELNYGRNKKLPQLRKEVNLAGHFDGIIGIDDKPNRNSLLKNGKPRFINKYYRYQLAQRHSFPANQVAILNIFGNMEDGSNSDGDVTRVSARSLKYLLRGQYKSYHEIEIKGPNAQHSKLHENNRVNKIINDFLWD
ncbi:alpha/beta hydrolase [Liquorilactobacillus capillatus]|nr:alpha/beta hydrolase [Liquorilactobacillus capillatus]